MQQKRATLAELRSVLGRLRAKDLKKAVSVLAEFPDSGLVSHDLNAELEAFQKADKQNKRKLEQDVELRTVKYLFSISFVKNLTSIEIFGEEVMRVVFLEPRFVKGYEAHLEEICGDSFREYWMEFLKSHVPEGRRAKLKSQIAGHAAQIVKAYFEVKATRTAQALSDHLPRMTGAFFLPMLDTATKAAALADRNKLADEFQRPNKKLSAKQLRKMITEPAWRHAKPFLDLPDGRPRVSNEEFMTRVRSAAFVLLASGGTLSVAKVAGQLHMDIRWVNKLMKRLGGWTKIKPELLAEWGQKSKPD